MGRVPYDPAKCAGGHRLHYGSGMPVFRGEINQGGYGLGSLLSGLARSVLPIISPIAKTIAKSVLRTGGHILSDVVSGKQSFKSSAKKRIVDAIQQHVETPVRKQRKRKKVSNDVFV